MFYKLIPRLIDSDDFKTEASVATGYQVILPARILKSLNENNLIGERIFVKIHNSLLNLKAYASILSFTDDTDNDNMIYLSPILADYIVFDSVDELTISIATSMPKAESVTFEIADDALLSNPDFKDYMEIQLAQQQLLNTGQYITLKVNGSSYEVKVIHMTACEIQHNSIDSQNSDNALAIFVPFDWKKRLSIKTKDWVNPDDNDVDSTKKENEAKSALFGDIIDVDLEAYFCLKDGVKSMQEVNKKFPTPQKADEPIKPTRQSSQTSLTSQITKPSDKPKKSLKFSRIKGRSFPGDGNNIYKS